MKNKRENGEVVVEASIIVTLVFIVISIMFYIGMVLYQQTAISTVANRTATNISQVYSNTLRDPFTGYVDPDNAYQSITYSNMKTDAYLDSIKQKGTAFAQYRLKKSQIIPAVDREVDVQVVNKPNEILKGQIVVTITDTYDVPLVGMFGLDSELTFTATGRADCVDYLEYLLGVEAIADPENSPIPSLPDSDTCIVTFVKDKYLGGFHAAVPVLRGKTIITSNNHSHSTMPANPELNGMKFTGWVTDDGKNFSASIQVDENITVYGTWDCKITFDPTGGTVDPTWKMVDYLGTTVFPTPTKSGYAFGGWYTQKNGAGKEYISNITQITQNITLYAKWNCIHDYASVKIKNGDCLHRSRFKYTCVKCSHSYEDDGNFGEHVSGEWVTTKSYGCGTKWQKKPCAICQATLDTRYVEGTHVWDARCGKEHDLGSDSYYMVTHSGNGSKQNFKANIKTVKGECFLCIKCGAPHPGVIGYDKNGNPILSDIKDFIVRNGQYVSNGMICIEHKKGNTTTRDAAAKNANELSEHVRH